jgi:hypothetical protein
MPQVFRTGFIARRTPEEEEDRGIEDEAEEEEEKEPDRNASKALHS